MAEEKEKNNERGNKKLKLDKVMEEKNKKIQELEEKLLLANANLINYRKRKDDETSNMLKFANQDLVNDLIPILDNFERAIKLDDSNLTDELSKFLDGFKMMYSQLIDILKNYGVKEIDCLGKEFDMNTSSALLIDNNPNYQDNVVIEVLLKGYTLKDRVIRPASVKVNKLENNKGESEENE